jgi:hypothetical protein
MTERNAKIRELCEMVRCYWGSPKAALDLAKEIQADLDVEPELPPEWEPLCANAPRWPTMLGPRPKYIEVFANQQPKEQGDNETKQEG